MRQTNACYRGVSWWMQGRKGAPALYGLVRESLWDRIWIQTQRNRVGQSRKYLGRKFPSRVKSKCKCPEVEARSGCGLHRRQWIQHGQSRPHETCWGWESGGMGGQVWRVLLDLVRDLACALSGMGRDWKVLSKGVTEDLRSYCVENGPWMELRQPCESLLLSSRCGQWEASLWDKQQNQRWHQGIWLETLENWGVHLVR